MSSFEIVSPVQGKVVDLTKVPDEVFAQKILGDGLAVEPEGDKAVFVAPADGVLTTVFRTGHAFIVSVGDKADILVHIGLDTVELNGVGFKTLKKEGDHAKKGDPVVEVDLAVVRSKGKSVISPVVVSNMQDISGVKAIAADGASVQALAPLFKVDL